MGDKITLVEEIYIWSMGVRSFTSNCTITHCFCNNYRVSISSKQLNENRFHVALIGEGASSSGEWWEAVNFAGIRGLPICYVLQNNQIALDTFSTNQSAAEIWADKAVAMGIPCWTIDGSDPAHIFHQLQLLESLH